MFTLLSLFENNIKTALTMALNLIEDQRKLKALEQSISHCNNAASMTQPIDTNALEESEAHDNQTNHLKRSQHTKHSIALMRINYTGEICAQALYSGQLHFAKNKQTKVFLKQARQEEQQHLIWCKQRLNELGGRTSYLDPLWYAGSYLIGAGAAYYSDAVSLGFVYHTEAQVEKHLHKHIAQLKHDPISSNILQKMALDEAEHGTKALQLGGKPLPKPIQIAMQATSKIMTGVSYYL